MRPGQQNKRGRGRGSNNNGGGNNNNNFNRKGGNPLTRTYDSSGPDVKIRGTAQHIAEKYSQLARDAQSSGDRVIAENYLQHAEHYYRIIAAAQTQMQERFQRDDRNEYTDREGGERDGDELDTADSDDAVVVQPPREQPRREQRAETAASVAAPAQETNDGTGPQPEIEGIPAEVSMEEEGGQQRERQPRRRNASNRPRRPRRAEGEGETASAEAPALAEAATE
ncbi:hypothetical protein AM571_CH03698 [Rhizobium etli 8C-3]|uniref:Uncharacterized protein DUF4167 n=2 Tax=Rhizobium TaxID=379 RepID=A0A4R3QGE6_9HYPH|nr:MULTISPECIES: DUF4167 domain-containing protein [Rhizobium]APO76483.1 hypothetical protein AM571_CH03698 [Rhizobium etli 8C-3]TCU18772.1 uncharacterized protein DUF4167 [Rhizobium azibense]TCU32056.1 uncharacterized protein DUF4167 [Rhizobium azibense]